MVRIPVAQKRSLSDHDDALAPLGHELHPQAHLDLRGVGTAGTGVDSNRLVALRSQQMRGAPNARVRARMDRGEMAGDTTLTGPSP